MTPDTVTNKEIAKVFKAAKKKLWNGRGNQHTRVGPLEWHQWHSKPRFICAAISELPFVWDLRSAAEEVIKERMGPKYRFNVLEDWLRIEHGIKAPYNSKQMQEYRHAWLDALIIEFSQ